MFQWKKSSKVDTASDEQKEKKPKKGKKLTKAQEKQRKEEEEEEKQLKEQQEQQIREQQEEKEREEALVLQKRKEELVSKVTSPYPFTECSPTILTAFTASVHNANEARLLINEMEKEPRRYIFDLFCFVFKLLEVSYDVNISACRFCDLMGLHLQAGIIAASFPFKKLLSIELDEDLAVDALNRLRGSDFGDKSCPVNYEVGFFNDYYEIFKNMEILYLDCNFLGPFLDEGVILKILFQCTRLAAPGTVLMLLTQQSISVDFSRHKFRVLHHKTNTPAGTIGNFWLCQKQ